jgi:hypothetical protein
MGRTAVTGPCGGAEAQQPECSTQLPIGAPLVALRRTLLQEFHGILLGAVSEEDAGDHAGVLCEQVT